MAVVSLTPSSSGERLDPRPVARSGDPAAILHRPIDGTDRVGRRPPSVGGRRPGNWPLRRARALAPLAAELRDTLTQSITTPTVAPITQTAIGREERHLLERVLRHRRADEPDREHRHDHGREEAMILHIRRLACERARGARELLLGRRLRARVPRLPLLVRRARLRGARRGRGRPARPRRVERPRRGRGRRPRRARGRRTHRRGAKPARARTSSGTGSDSPSSTASRSSTGSASSSSAARTSTTA